MLVASGTAEKVAYRLSRLLRSLPALVRQRSGCLGNRTAVASLIRRVPVALIGERIRIGLPEKGIGVLREGEGVVLIALRALVSSRIRACASTGRVAILVLLLFFCWHFLAWLRSPGTSIVVYRFDRYMPGISCPFIAQKKNRAACACPASLGFLGFPVSVGFRFAFPLAVPGSPGFRVSRIGNISCCSRIARIRPGASRRRRRRGCSRAAPR